MFKSFIHSTLIMLPSCSKFYSGQDKLKLTLPFIDIKTWDREISIVINDTARTSTHGKGHEEGSFGNKMGLPRWLKDKEPTAIMQEMQFDTSVGKMLWEGRRNYPRSSLENSMDRRV